MTSFFSAVAIHSIPTLSFRCDNNKFMGEKKFFATGKFVKWVACWIYVEYGHKKSCKLQKQSSEKIWRTICWVWAMNEWPLNKAHVKSMGKVKGNMKLDKINLMAVTTFHQSFIPLVSIYTTTDTERENRWEALRERTCRCGDGGFMSAFKVAWRYCSISLKLYEHFTFIDLVVIPSCTSELFL